MLTFKRRKFQIGVQWTYNLSKLNMFPSFFYLLWGIHCEYAHFCGGVPFIWDPNTRQSYVTKRSIRWCQIQALLLFESAIYIGARVLYIKFWGNVSDLGFPMGLFLASIYDCLGFTSLLLTPEHLVCTTNEFFTYWAEFTSKSLA